MTIGREFFLSHIHFNGRLLQKGVIIMPVASRPTPREKIEHNDHVTIRVISRQSFQSIFQRWLKILFPYRSRCYSTSRKVVYCNPRGGQIRWIIESSGGHGPSAGWKNKCELQRKQNAALSVSNEGAGEGMVRESGVLVEGVSPADMKPFMALVTDSHVPWIIMPTLLRNRSPSCRVFTSAFTVGGWRFGLFGKQPPLEAFIRVRSEWWKGDLASMRSSTRDPPASINGKYQKK